MHPLRPRTCAIIATSAILLAGLAGLAGCTDSAVQGPQIAQVPRGFRFDPNARAARLVLDRRSPVSQRGYFRLGPNDRHSSIMITEYRGAISSDEVKRALDDARSYYPAQRYGPIESLRIASRPAWAWLVTQADQGTIASLCYTAVIPDAKADRTYTVEFYTSEPEYQSAQVLKRTVMSFTVGGSPAWKARLGL